ncbi:hypothetical protein ACHQM5_023360 [Ranunculus cassubicifolius]
MEKPHGCLAYTAYFLLFLPVFILLFFVGFIKSTIFAPFVFLVIAFGDAAVIIGLWPLHLIWTSYCIYKSKKFGPWMKGVLIISLPIPIAIWTVVGVVGTVVMAIGYAYVWPVMETFRAISKPGVQNKLVRTITDGTWSNVWGACTIVRDFADFSFHSYFSVTDEWLEAKDDEKPLEIKITQIPGCILAAILGILVDVPMFIVIVTYKAPLMLFKGWHRLIEDLVGRSGPFLETVCVPFAGLLIVLWPFAVLLAFVAGMLSSFGFGFYAAVVAYQENSTKRGLLYAIASVSLFDEYTNDLLYLQEGSCFPRPKYKVTTDDNLQHMPRRGLREQVEALHAKHLLEEPSEKPVAVKAIVIWDHFFKGCEISGEELTRDGAIGIADLEAWQQSKSKIVNVGIPTYTFMHCFLKSIKSGSSGFILRDNVEVTHLNRPEGRVFDWLYDPMLVMKEQIKSLDLVESEELYLCKLCLYYGDNQRIEAWNNGGVPPNDEIKIAQLEAITRRLQGFCLTLTRLPTFRRRYQEVVKALVIEIDSQLRGHERGDSAV